MRRLACILALLGLGLATTNTYAAEKSPTERLNAATDILERTLTLPEQQIPPALLRDAQGLAVIPGVIKAGFVVGGSYGRGVLTVRDRNGHWSQPIFLKLVAGSVGWQIGAQSTDVVLVFKTKRSIEGLLHGKFTLGADAAVAAGPIGRRGEAATDAQLKAEIVSYSRSRGLFAGVSLEGAQLDVDHEADTGFYGKEATADDIRAGKVSGNAASARFMAAVRKAIGQ